MHLKSILSLALAASYSMSAETPKLSEAMEVGDAVLVDIVAPDPSNPQDGKAYLSKVELSAAVNVDEGLTGNIVLGSYEGDLSKVGVDQAYGALALPDHKVSLYFGQQYYNFGLLNTRLTTYPEQMYHVITWAPGFQAGWQATENIALTLGGFYENGSYSVATPSFGSILTFDYTSEMANAKVSYKGTKRYGMADLATTLNFGPLVLEGEVYSNIGKMAEGVDDAGYLVGSEFKFSDAFSVAGRFESISADQFETSSKAFAVGPIWHAPKNIFVALEYGQKMGLDGADDDGEIRIQVGHTTKLKLPGFSRSGLETQD